MGSIVRQGRDRVVCMELESSGRYFACHVSGTRDCLYKVRR